uniref:Uncharacterized protein n=1 Tax=Rhizophora mucronata TaxID=61149 RepID=A0A2P2P466_RHIMU
MLDIKSNFLQRVNILTPYHLVLNLFKEQILSSKQHYELDKCSSTYSAYNHN